jgi:hypothetical protein
MLAHTLSTPEQLVTGLVFLTLAGRALIWLMEPERRRDLLGSHGFAPYILVFFFLLTGVLLTIRAIFGLF